MSDRREPQIAAVLKRLEGFQHEHVIRAVGERITQALADTPDTETVCVELPELHGAKVTIRGLPPSLGQRLRAKLAS